jgi:hypothetical protein
MKNLFFILILLLFYSCSQPKYSVCIPIVHPDSIKTQMIPIAVGNYWVYEDNYSTRGKKDILKIEVISIDTVFVNVNGQRTQTLAYKLEMDRSLGNHPKIVFYYIKCESRIQLGYADISDPSNVTYISNVIFENPGAMAYDSARKKNSKISYAVINTRFGNLSCKVIEEETGFDVSGELSFLNAFLYKSYYCLGLGLVRVEYFNKFGKVLTNRELINYEVMK